MRYTAIGRSGDDSGIAQATGETQRARRDRLFGEYRRLLTPIALRILGDIGPGFQLDDLVQEGAFGLFRAIETFNPGKVESFEQHARVCIRGAILKATEKELIRTHRRKDDEGNKLPSRKRAEQLSPTFERVETGPSPEHVAIHRNRLRLVDAAVRQLPRAEREVMDLRQQGLTQSEIGKRLGIHQSTARARELRAIENLKPKLAA